MLNIPMPNAWQAPTLTPDEWTRLFNHPTLNYTQMAKALGISYNCFTNYRLGRSTVPYAIRYCLEALAGFGTNVEPTEGSFPISHVGGLYITEADCTINGYLRHSMGLAGPMRFRDGYLIPMERTAKTLQKLSAKVAKGGYCTVQKILSTNEAKTLVPPDWTFAESSSVPSVTGFVFPLEPNKEPPFNPYADEIEETSRGLSTTAEAPTLPPYLQAILDDTK